MSKKISELESVNDLHEDSCFPLVQDNKTRKVTYETLKNEVTQNIDTFYANGADYAEVAIWNDENPSNENRLHRFVTLESTGRKIKIANSADQIVGVTTIHAAFVGNAKNYNKNDSTKSLVGIVGVVSVKTNDSTIEANDRVMSDDNGYAIKSTNNCGYRVLQVLDNNLLEIVVSPNTDMIQRIKTDMEKKQNKLIAGKNIEIEDDVISAIGGITEEEKEEIVNMAEEKIQPQITEIHEEVSQLDKDITNVDNKVTALNEELQEQEGTLNDLADKIDEIKSAEVIEIGEYQYSYKGTILPAIPVDILKSVYVKDKAGTPITLHWTLYGTENNLKIVSSDLIAGTYSIDVLVHNKFHCAYEWTESSTGNINPKVETQEGGGSSTDVQINGTSITQDGVANIPIAGRVPNAFGLTFATGSYGTQIVNNTGEIRTLKASNAYIDSRKHDYNPIVPSTLDYAVKQAMCDGKGAEWSSEEQLSARKRLGLEKEWELKGVINTENKDSRVTVDLSGCSELLIRGTIDATGTSNLNCDYGGMLYQLARNGQSVMIAKWTDGFLGMEPSYCMYRATNSKTSALTSSGYAYFMQAKTIASINYFEFAYPNVITTCEVEIYAK